MNENKKDTDITLSLLQSIAEASNITQRSLAKRLGLALGLTNNYLKNCIKDGLIKIEQVPANKYLYYLTPKGFARKSKLMASYLNCSMRIFREVRSECLEFFTYCIENKLHKVAVIGKNDLSEISNLIAVNNGLNLRIFEAWDQIDNNYDAWIIADTKKAQAYYDLLVEQVFPEKIFCFSILKVRQKLVEEQL